MTFSEEYIQKKIRRISNSQEIWIRNDTDFWVYETLPNGYIKTIYGKYEEGFFTHQASISDCNIGVIIAHKIVEGYRCFVIKLKKK